MIIGIGDGGAGFGCGTLPTAPFERSTRSAGTHLEERKELQDGSLDLRLHLANARSQEN